LWDTFQESTTGIRVNKQSLRIDKKEVMEWKRRTVDK
jgi:hypothetical protein